jgi:hypothetical protein
MRVRWPPELLSADGGGGKQGSGSQHRGNFFSGIFRRNLLSGDQKRSSSPGSIRVDSSGACIADSPASASPPLAEPSALPGTRSYGNSGGARRLFCGLRVRMGVADGIVSPGEDVRSSRVKARCCAIGAAACGGQTLIGPATFAAVKDRLQELSAVDHSGLNSRLLAAQPRGRLSKLLHSRQAAWDAAREDPLCLDMGAYYLGDCVGSAKAVTPSTLRLYQIAPARRAGPKGGGGGGIAWPRAQGSLPAALELKKMLRAAPSVPPLLSRVRVAS